MYDLQLANRLQNIFGAPQPTFDTAPISVAPSPEMTPTLNLPTPQMGMPNPQMAEEEWITRRLAELYQPQNQMQEAFQGLLSQMPQMEQPSGWTRFGAALAGMGAENPMQAMQIGNQLSQAPYYRNLEQWKARAEPTLKGAALEQDANQNARILAEQTLQRELQRRRDLETERKNKENERIAAFRADTGRYSAEIRDWKARNPNMQVVMPQGGFVTGVNPQTGQGQLIRDPQGNPIPTGTLSQQDRLDIEQSNRLEVVGAQGVQQRLNIAAQGDQTRRNILTPRPPSSTTIGRRSQADIAKERHNRAKKLFETRPDLKPFISVADTGTGFGIVPVGGRRGPNQQQFEEIRNFIFQGEEQGTGTQLNNIPAGGVNKPPVTTGKVLMIAPDGKTEGYVPANQVEAALAQGYKRK